MNSRVSSSLPGLIERTRIKLTVCPDLRAVLHEEVEQWVTEAEGLQAIVDPEFERPSDVDDLAREVKETKEWLGTLAFVVSPEFLNVKMNAEPEVVGCVAKEPEVEKDGVREPEIEPIAVPPESPQPSATVQPVSTKRRPMFLSSEDKGEDAPTPKKPRKERTPSVEIVAVKPTPAQRCKGRVNAQVAESDKILQSVVKHGYPEHAYLLRWTIYVGHEVLTRPAKCGRCLCYGHICSGEAGRMRGRCIRYHQGCVLAEEYVGKDEKDGREPEVRSKDRRVRYPEGTRTSMLASEERVEELVERFEELMRSVSRKLNDLSGEVLELEGVQATIRKLMK
ncbi:hypothetical protein JB92DRAFT_2838994 [Gautieria morchelliformis]|nr:hypothetical protein JB92DRAFT_2838994 [Gautieria morchelliformis]